MTTKALPVPMDTLAPSLLASRLTAMAIASALFMEFVDSTALSTALPTLASAFNTDPVHLKLALTSYILALAITAPASGWVADRMGPKQVFSGAMVLFLLGSVLCGLSHTLSELVAARIVQGIGGGMMTPVGRLILVGSSPPERLVSTMSWFTMPALIGPMLGPALSGFLLTVASWPWIFFINVPVGIIGIMAVTRYVPRLQQAAPGKFDTKGFVLSCIAISGLVIASGTVGGSSVSAGEQVGVTAVALVASLVFIRHALRTPKPILNLRLLAFPTFRGSICGGTLARIGIGATPFLLPLLLQVGLHWSPLQSGGVTIASALGGLLSKPFLPRLVRRFGFRSAMISANLIGGVLTAAPAAFYGGTPTAVIFLILVLYGFTRSAQFTAINAVAFADLPREFLSSGATLSAVAQQVGLCLGISVGGLLLHLTESRGGGLSPHAFVMPFLVVGLLTLMATPIFQRLHPDVGALMRGR